METVEQRQLWKQMMPAQDRQVAGALAGAQLRYLINSEHGWLGGLCLSAAPG